jgi:hypothetical protein
MRQILMTIWQSKNKNTTNVLKIFCGRKLLTPSRLYIF